MSLFKKKNVFKYYNFSNDFILSYLVVVAQHMRSCSKSNSKEFDILKQSHLIVRLEFLSLSVVASMWKE